MQQRLKKYAVPTIELAGIRLPRAKRSQQIEDEGVSHTLTHKAIVNFNTMRSGCRPFTLRCFHIFYLEDNQT